MYKILFGILSILTFLVVSFYVWRWDIGYSSDVALYGLSSKDILVKGSMPLTLWSMAYPGLLLQGPLTVFFFKLFGISPSSLCLEPALFFLCLFP